MYFIQRAKEAEIAYGWYRRRSRKYGQAYRAKNCTKGT